ncbi:SDR family NAD(P)-dependent oxidoreductase [Acetomicrobium mobile]|mgnify:FL=1|uniref:SDR family NAD(P)-dependent oxidoreductase n=1 Tax=Acetomicrobium mobile TaxID=97477 RepID=UPI0026EAC292|nr:SDR family NAD(P)-dependent oxidoreductase [Acetomicrobium mobile]
MTWKNKKVLVTGAGGFIGSHVVERLVEAGATVRAFVHYNALGTWGWLDESSVCDSIEVVSGDICDRDNIRQAMKDIEIVFHLAALIGIPYSYCAPLSYVRTNIEGTLNVLQAAREFNVKRVVHTSTSETYGTARYVPIDEKHPLQGQSPYSATKIGADKMAEAFYLSFGLPIVTVRPFNTFGPRQSARAVIPTIITQCLTSDMVRLGNLYPTRDLTYVSDTVRGFILAASAPGAVGRTINIGSGREISIGNLAELITRLIGKPVDIESDMSRIRPANSEVERLIADNTLAQHLLGWEPEVSLEEGLIRTIEWVRQHLRRYRSGVYAI